MFYLRSIKKDFNIAEVFLIGVVSCFEDP